MARGPGARPGAPHAPFLNRRRIRAALAAIESFLAGAAEPGEGDWPDDVTVEDMEGARDALNARLQASEQETERSLRSGLHRVRRA